MAFGYDQRPFTTAEGAQMVEVTLPDGKYELPFRDHQKIAHESLDADDYRSRILTWSAESANEWARERGPDSELGRNMEAGTPTQPDRGGATDEQH